MTYFTVSGRTSLNVVKSLGGKATMLIILRQFLTYLNAVNTDMYLYDDYIHAKVNKLLTRYTIFLPKVSLQQ